MPGVPNKCTPERLARLEQAIRAGATYRLACLAAGITQETLYEWRRKKPIVSETINRAESDAALAWLTVIDKAATDGVWQAAAWKLERRYPQEYGRTVQEVSGAGGGPLTFTIALDRANAGPSGAIDTPTTPALTDSERP